MGALSLPERRLAAQGAAAWLCARAAAPVARAAAASFASPASAPVALALVMTGFLIPPAQYASYARLLDELGVRPVVIADGSTLREPVSLELGADRALAAVEREAARLGVPSSTPLVLVGHSRGGKGCAIAASRSARAVGAMVLLDPVDATPFEPGSALPALRATRAPALVLGSGVGSSDCAPPGANFAAFYAALAPGTPRLLGVLARAGHTQFLDDRPGLFLDVCSAGADSDRAVGDVARTAMAVWCTRHVPDVAERLRAPRGAGLPAQNEDCGGVVAGWRLPAGAVAAGAEVASTLQAVRFGTSVDWRAS